MTDSRDDKAHIEHDKGGLLKDVYRWVLENAEFKRWRDDEQSPLLWIKGDPGKGKTMLLCGIIGELRSKQSSPVSFFFCRGTDSRFNNATAVLRGLLYLLLEEQPYLLSHVRKRYDTAGKPLFEGDNAWFALSTICADVLQDPGLEKTYLVVDALDECIADLPKLLRWIVQMSSGFPRIKWVVSSRNWQEIEKHLSGATQRVRLCLTLNEDSVSAAVATYIRLKVEELAELNRYTNDITNAIQRYLSAHAHGTFLWVALVCQNLSKVKRWNIKAELRIDVFPPGLDDLYQKMLDRIQVLRDIDLCKRILATASVVYRPITLEELRSLVELPEGLADDDLAEIIADCGSFLTLRERSIFFVHQSAKDFLLRTATAQTTAQIFPSGLGDIHHNIFSRSLQVLLKTLCRDVYGLCAPGFPIDKVQKPDPDPLVTARYSCIFWVDHLEASCPDPSSSDLQDGSFVHNFLRQSYLYWLEALSLLKNMSAGIRVMEKLEGLLQVGLAHFSMELD